MKRVVLFVLFLCLSLLCISSAQVPPPQSRVPGTPEENPTLPNGKSQHNEIVKADYKKNLEDAAELAKIAEELKYDLEKNDKYLVSVKNIKQTEEIEKLARGIRGRLKRY